MCADRGGGFHDQARASCAVIVQPMATAGLSDTEPQCVSVRTDTHAAVSAPPFSKMHRQPARGFCGSDAQANAAQPRAQANFARAVQSAGPNAATGGCEAECAAPSTTASDVAANTSTAANSTCSVETHKTKSSNRSSAGFRPASRAPRLPRLLEHSAECSWDLLQSDHVAQTTSQSSGQPELVGNHDSTAAKVFASACGGDEVLTSASEVSLQASDLREDFCISGDAKPGPSLTMEGSNVLDAPVPMHQQPEPVVSGGAKAAGRDIDTEVTIDQAFLRMCATMERLGFGGSDAAPSEIRAAAVPAADLADCIAALSFDADIKTELQTAPKSPMTGKPARSDVTSLLQHGGVTCIADVLPAPVPALCEAAAGVSAEGQELVAEGLPSGKGGVVVSLGADGKLSDTDFARIKRAQRE